MCIPIVLIRCGRICLSALVTLAVLEVPTVHGQNATSTKAETRATIGFDQIQPILRKRCQNCHNTEELRGDLSVADFGALKAGSSSGPVVVAGRPRESLLYTTAAHLDEPTMPPNSRKIPARELELIRLWIEGGLVKKSGYHSPVTEIPSQPMVNNASALPGGSVILEPVKRLLQPSALPTVAKDPAGKFVAVPGDRQIALLDLRSNSFSQAIPFPEPDITQLTFTNDGKRVLVGGGSAGLNGSVYGFDVQSGQKLFKIADESDSIIALDLSPDDQVFAFGGPTKLLKVCRVADGKVLHTMRKHTDWIMCTKFSKDGLLLASGDRFGGIFVWEAASGALFHELNGHEGPVHSLVWDGDGETLLSAGEDGKVRVWNMHHGELTAQWDGGVGAILSIDRASSLTLVGGRDGLAKIWKTPDSSIATYDAGVQVDHALIVDGARCVVTDASGNIHCLSLPDLKPIKSLSLPVHEVGRSELMARLEQKRVSFEEALKARKLQQFAINRAPAQNALTTTNKTERPIEAPGTRLPSALQRAEPEHRSDLAVIADALRAEVELAKRTLDEQRAEREHAKRRLAKLQSELEQKSIAIAATEDLINRLQAMLQLAFPANSDSVKDRDE